MEEKIRQTIAYLEEQKRRKEETISESAARLKSIKDSTSKISTLTMTQMSRVGNAFAGTIKAKKRMIKRLQMSAHPEKVYKQLYNELKLLTE